MKRLSLRLRLFTIILLPLMVLALMIGVWRIGVAQATAKEFFDRNLMFTAVAVSRDVARGDGDALSLETETLLSETAGGPVRYHVYGPDGVLVTGYAVPPIPPGRLSRDVAFAYYDATYRGAPVRVLRLKDEASIDNLSGIFTITVWQDLEARNAFVWALALRSAAVMATLLLAVAALVWFGVAIGLKPLTDLEDAISTRSPEDLSPIKRAVPVEARGIVSQLNALLDRMRSTFDAQAAFVSDAAHQLRNPIAGMRALGESIQTAGTLEAARTRAGDLVSAAAKATDLANRLLTLERARAESGTEGFARVDLCALVRDTVSDMQRATKARGVTLTANAADVGAHLVDALMLREALTNLIDNALMHGGTGLTEIVVTLGRSAGTLTLSVENDGASVAPEDIPKILARFGQMEPGAGSGLGLSIADAVAKRHGGTLSVHPREHGFAVTITLPAQDRTDAGARTA
ncbi:sensor histidine kinase [Aestuariicoccus sp. MJ-SS9]|uniref:sensor histidine kinase n=1 Tax=Aestuariicoccus sp. MJ-SS9 TaxID=3079855 RepID=UPI0029134F66|nr:sensor histidine kinase [Aestuariicoccus sp. MJ-SS9]MDU8909763.1 sensor histidine kinase [Aestuariicoccus sp. MJ-SS9]